MKISKISVLAVFVCGIFMTGTAHAASCNHVRPSSKRMECLQRKIANLNDVVQKTKSELTLQVKKQAALEFTLTAVRNELNSQIEKMGALESRVAVAESGLKGAIKSGESVNIQSHVFVDKCLDQRSNPNPTPQADEVRMVTCVFTDPADKWTLTR